MKDRIPKYPGRVKLNPVAGQANTFDLVRADEPTEPGTPLNKASLLSDSTATALGLGSNATPDEAFRNIVDELALGKEVLTHGDAPPIGTVVSYYNGSTNTVVNSGTSEILSGRYISEETAYSATQFMVKVEDDKYIFFNITKKRIELIKINGCSTEILDFSSRNVATDSNRPRKILKINSNKYAFISNTYGNYNNLTVEIFSITNDKIVSLSTSEIYFPVTYQASISHDNDKILILSRVSYMLFTIIKVNSDNSLTLEKDRVATSDDFVIYDNIVKVTNNVIACQRYVSGMYYYILIMKIDSANNLLYNYQTADISSNNSPFKITIVSSDRLLASNDNYIYHIGLNDYSYSVLSSLSTSANKVSKPYMTMLNSTYFICVAYDKMCIGKITSNSISFVGTAATVISSDYTGNNLLIDILPNNSFRVIGTKTFTVLDISAVYNVTERRNSSFMAIAGVVSKVITNNKVFICNSGVVQGVKDLTIGKKYYLDTGGTLKDEVRTMIVASQPPLIGVALSETAMVLRIGGL